MKKYNKELIFAGFILLVFGILVFLETQLPFFKKFLPISENKLIIVMLNINLLLILLLLFFVSRALIKTFVEQKRGLWGARLKTKLTITLLIVSIIPSLTLYILSAGFIQVNIDKWFGQKIEDALDDAMEFSRFYYEDLFQRHERVGAIIANEINRKKLLDNSTALADLFTMLPAIPCIATGRSRKRLKKNFQGWLTRYQKAKKSALSLPLKRANLFFPG